MGRICSKWIWWASRQQPSRRHMKPKQVTSSCLQTTAEPSKTPLSLQSEVIQINAVLQKGRHLDKQKHLFCTNSLLQHRSSMETSLVQVFRLDSKWWIIRRTDRLSILGWINTRITIQLKSRLQYIQSKYDNRRDSGEYGCLVEY